MSDNLRVRAEKRVDKKIRFYINLSVFLAVNTMLFFINWYYTPEFWWVAFPLVFWGLGVLKDFLVAFIFANTLDSESYRERKIQEEMEKLRV